MKKTITFIYPLFLSACISTFDIGQKSFVSGGIYFKNGEISFVDMYYLEMEQAILYKKGDGLKISTTYAIDSFFFNDEKMDTQRRFRNIVFEGEELFFEILVYGKIEVLGISRSRLGTDSGHLKLMMGGLLTDTDYRYFIFHDGQALPMSQLGISDMMTLFPDFNKWLNVLEIEGRYELLNNQDRLAVIKKISRMLKECKKSSVGEDAL